MLRFLLFPFQWLFILTSSIRKSLYLSGILKRHTYPVPVICFGNLSMGGSGKTPHVKHMALLLRQEGFQVAILLRGYKRKSRGIVLCSSDHSVKDIGDEAFEYVHSLPNDIPIVVARNRHKGILFLLQQFPQVDVILMDDGYQHFRVKANRYVLLTDFFHPYFRDHVLPVGTLREPKSARKRADFIIVSKTPKILSPLLKEDFMKKLKPFPHQQVFFSYYQNIELVPLYDQSYSSDRPYAIYLITGIQNPGPIEEVLQKKCFQLKSYLFPDHHNFKKKEIEKFLYDFERDLVSNKIIVTTEKDVPRLLEGSEKMLKKYPIFVIKSYIAFHKTSEESFEQKIIDYVRKNCRNEKVH